MDSKAFRYIEVIAGIVATAGLIAYASDRRWGVYIIAFTIPLMIQTFLALAYLQAVGDALAARGVPRWHAFIPIVPAFEITFFRKTPRARAGLSRMVRLFALIGIAYVAFASRYPSLLIVLLPIVLISVLANFRAIGDALVARGYPRWHWILGSWALLEILFTKNRSKRVPAPRPQEPEKRNPPWPEEERHPRPVAVEPWKPPRLPAPHKPRET